MNSIKKLTKGSIAIVVVIFIISSFSFITQSCTNNISDHNIDRELAIEDFKKTISNERPKLENFVNENRSNKNFNILQAQKELDNVAKVRLNKILESSKNLLYSFEFKDQDFEDMPFDINDPQIIYMSFAILEIERISNKNKSFGNILIETCIQNAYASDFWDCAKQAVGISVAIEVYRNAELSTFAGRRRLIKTFTKVGARYLGWAGAAIATYDFIDCMW